ncbi:dialkylrecorsinol condensing enzyme DarA [Sphingobacterium lumbrici]|uniref:dialkylrecorsinol condensing enzyme DarA n=1 Tax=Sphingobacterium lumbrici TaxID=2559600 RepID=UPI0011277A4D|nr:dialkylrecorsinol condensing enzyme DarA [Sphingobacterium lumbrici]
MKNVLVIYFSQSGQLQEIAQSICGPMLADPEINVDFYEIKMVHSFPFPWTGSAFFDTFPETFQQIPEEIHPPSPIILEKEYDLVLFHYQVWYLSPSIPINSFLKSRYATPLLKGRPIITVSGTRNMWAKAQDKVKKLIISNGGMLVGNIALTDRHPNLISVITIVDWLFSGVKKNAFGIFPMPGVSEEEIKNSAKFGGIIIPYLKNGNFEQLQHELVENGAVKFRFFLVSMDQKGNRMFDIWSKLILRNPKRRKTLVTMFKYYVILALYVLSPIVFVVELILYPLLYFIKIRKDRAHYLGV